MDTDMLTYQDCRKTPWITETDKKDILFGIKQKVNFIALSFVRSLKQFGK
ncbi:MAG: hypothetical protein CM1200mP30_26080 [Pseudomonadota bacterium]|nr:MAG: hypothetical protein CM1200mP30_26080 [Pseudomonadota bacterium]